MCASTVKLCLNTSWEGSHPGAKKLQLFLRLGKDKTHIPSKEGEEKLCLFVDDRIFYVETLRAL